MYKEIVDFMGLKRFQLIVQLVVLALSIWLVVTISIDTFHGIDFYQQHQFHKDQFWICMVFLADYFIGLIIAKKKWHYFFSHFLFLVVSIPYQAIIYHFEWHQYLSEEVYYIIRYMPLIRGGFAMAIVVNWITSNRVTGLFLSYIITLVSTVYFASLTFYLFERGVNSGVTTYGDALWWAAMDVTTVGSNIVAVTTVGRVLSVVLAGLGMMMFPIFTVYVTNLITRKNESREDTKTEFLQAFKNIHSSRSNDTDSTTVSVSGSQTTDNGK